MITGLAQAQLSPEDLVVNDSMNVFVSDSRQEAWIDRFDSTNRLLGDCGIVNYFGGNYLTLKYVHGVCYIEGRDSMALFLVDFRTPDNEVRIRKLKLKSGMTQKQFERKIRRCKCKETREETERIKGYKEVAYTVYKDESGLAYRVFFRDGVIQALLLYLPCEEK